MRESDNFDTGRKRTQCTRLERLHKNYTVSGIKCT